MAERRPPLLPLAVGVLALAGGLLPISAAQAWLSGVSVFCL